MKVVILLAVLAAVAAADPPPLSDEFINNLESVHKTWQVGKACVREIVVEKTAKREQVEIA